MGGIGEWYTNFTYRDSVQEFLFLSLQFEFDIRGIHAGIWNKRESTFLQFREVYAYEMMLLFLFFLDSEKFWKKFRVRRIF